MKTMDTVTVLVVLLMQLLHSAAQTFQPTNTANLKAAVDACFDEHKGTTKDGLCPNYLAAQSYPPMGDWDISLVTSLDDMFNGQEVFENHNVDISNWNTANVVTMKKTFMFNNKFNGDISQWNVAKVELMYATFTDNFEFNADISEWNVGKVQDFKKCFYYCKKFNADISNVRRFY